MPPIPKELLVAILSAILGGLFTLIVTYVNFKVKRFELKYNYRMKLDENYFLNAQQHLNEVYIPLYKILHEFKKSWLVLKNSEKKSCSIDTFINNKINELQIFTENLENKGLTVFLIPDIENSFTKLLVFLSRSLSTKELAYSLSIEYEKICLRRIVFYNEEIPMFIKRKSIHKKDYRKIVIKFYKNIFNFLNYFKTALPFSLVDYEIRVTIASAPLESEEFSVQLLSFIKEINNKIKDVTLGMR